MSQGFTNIGEYQKGKNKSRLGSQLRDDSAIRGFFDKKPGRSLEDTARNKINRYLDSSNISPDMRTVYKQWLVYSKDLHTMNMNVLSKVFELYHESGGVANDSVFSFENLFPYVQSFVPENVIQTYETNTDSERIVLFAMIDCIRYFFYIEKLSSIKDESDKKSQSEILQENQEALYME